MPARLARHLVAAGAATCALALATAAPGIARPIGHPPPRGAHDARADDSAVAIPSPGDGTDTLAVVLIAGGALAAGAGAGFAGGRRAGVRLR